MINAGHALSMLSIFFSMSLSNASLCLCSVAQAHRLTSGNSLHPSSDGADAMQELIDGRHVLFGALGRCSMLVLYFLDCSDLVL